MNLRFWTVAFLTLAMASPARAQDTEQLERCQALVRQKRPVQAEAACRVAIDTLARASSEPQTQDYRRLQSVLHVFLGQALQLQARHPDALVAYQKADEFLSNETTRKSIELLSNEVALTSTPSGASVTLLGATREPWGQTPVTRKVLRGTYTLLLERPGHVSQTISLKVGDPRQGAASLNVLLEPIPAAVQEPKTSLVPVVLLGSSVASAVVSGLYLGGYYHYQPQITSVQARSTRTTPEIDAFVQDQQARFMIGWSAAGIGVALLTASVLTWTW